MQLHIHTFGLRIINLLLHLVPEVPRWNPGERKYVLVGLPGNYNEDEIVGIMAGKL